MQLQRGQKTQLQQLGLQFDLSIEIQIQAPFTIDLSCFGLDQQQKLSDEAEMVFYNQPRNPDGSVEWQANQQQFVFKLQQVNLNKLQRFVICAAIDDPQAVMTQIQNGIINIKNPQGQTIASFTLEAKIFAQEKAVMLAEIYFKEVWRLGIVAQGFNGGLGALVEHFGGEVAEDTSNTTTQPTSIPSTPVTTSPTPSKTTSSNINLNKIQLEKTGQSHRINLDKTNTDYLRIEAIWVDNGDNRSNNDDLDLRVGLMLQHQKDMDYIWCPDHQGSLNAYPYIQHQGDIQAASVSEPGKETVLVHPDLAKKLGGRVALVFSVYSAVSNGAVSIASLQPKMRMQYGDQVVECVFNTSVSAKAKSRFVYTYVIGVAIIDETGITLQHSGLTSNRFSENTPRIIWNKDDTVEIKVDGKPMFK